MASSWTTYEKGTMASNQEVLLCYFRPNVGWQVRAVATSDSDRVAVVFHEGEKLMRIPTIRAMRRGSFCNPKKLALSYVRSRRCQLQLGASQ